MAQLALPLALADHAVFASYWPAGNEAAVRFLRGLDDGEPVRGAFLFGPPAVGKTHLLQACCDLLGDRAMYLPLRVLREAGPDILAGVASRPFLCVDDIDSVAGDADWETALFGLYNELLDAQGTLVATAAGSVRECGIELADLESRLAQLAPFRLTPLSEADRIRALQLRSRHRGLDLPDETARFLLNRGRRDMASLHEQLDRLDAEALRAQRRLTVPFVKEVLKV